MTYEKSKRILKLQAVNEIRNDDVYERNIFVKNRRLQSKFCVPITLTRRIDNEDQVRE